MSRVSGRRKATLAALLLLSVSTLIGAISGDRNTNLWLFSSVLFHIFLVIGGYLTALRIMEERRVEKSKAVEDLERFEPPKF